MMCFQVEENTYVNLINDVFAGGGEHICQPDQYDVFSGGGEHINLINDVFAGGGEHICQPDQ